jgi:hypothetical protein
MIFHVCEVNTIFCFLYCEFYILKRFSDGRKIGIILSQIDIEEIEELWCLSYHATIQ